MELADLFKGLVYEANASRPERLGPNLGATVAYCLAILDHVARDHNAARAIREVNRNGSLQTVEAKFNATVSYLAAVA